MTAPDVRTAAQAEAEQRPPAELDQKLCSRCGHVKPTAEFFPRKERPGQFLSGCKSCRRAAYWENDAVRSDKIARAKSWHSKHPTAWRDRPSATKERARVYRWNSRAKGAGTGVTFEQVRQRFQVFGNRCWMCLADGDMTIDHVKPRSKGGAHLASNIRPACSSCNSRKGDRWDGASRIHELAVVNS